MNNELEKIWNDPFRLKLAPNMRWRKVQNHENWGRIAHIRTEVWPRQIQGYDRGVLITWLRCTGLREAASGHFSSSYWGPCAGIRSRFVCLQQVSVSSARWAAQKTNVLFVCSRSARASPSGVASSRRIFVDDTHQLNWGEVLNIKPFNDHVNEQGTCPCLMKDLKEINFREKKFNFI